MSQLEPKELHFICHDIKGQGDYLVRSCRGQRPAWDPGFLDNRDRHE
jgi:hypothetical protein